MSSGECRIKGLLFGQGIRGINVMKDYKTLAPVSVQDDERLNALVSDRRSQHLSVPCVDISASFQKKLHYLPRTVKRRAAG